MTHNLDLFTTIFPFFFFELFQLLFYIKNSPNYYMTVIWAFIYSNLIGNSIGLNICGMWVYAPITYILLKLCDR
ncbi:hypothetical protein PL11201_440025 [Planktothrix sp. PCC 11201]|nr:hypothetical protein PL11201_440025 [Planktothrix sp. PCC 11201]